MGTSLARIALLTGLCVISSCTAEVVEEAELAGGEAALDYDPGPGFALAWRDEFDGTSLNAANWTVVTSNYDPVTSNCNFGTSELEYPRAQNVTVAGGKLVIRAERASDWPADARCWGQGGRTFYSGRLHTKGKVERRYGKIVASIKIPSGYGMWPAFWTLGANVANAGWPGAGEIDILEWHANDPAWMKSATHWSANGSQADWGTGQSPGYAITDAFHTYEVEWTARSMVFRLDGRYVGATYYHNESEFQQNHFLILNLAIGGSWYGHPNPASIALPAGTTKTMEVEWVRWYDVAPIAPGTVLNPGFESGSSGWSTYSPNGTDAAAFTESYGGSHGGALHLTHWSAQPFEAWTYQVVTGLPAGSYRLRGWVKKGGNFALSRLQTKTCAQCAPSYVDLASYGGYTLVETPPIAVTGGSLEIGLHSRVTSAQGDAWVYLDDVQLVKQ